MWWQLAQNPHELLAYYSSPPQLIGVEIQSVHIHHDGPTVELTADLPFYPDKPSPRWPVGANTAQIGLRFFGVREITLAGWSTNNVGDLIIAETGGVLTFQFACSAAKLTGVARFFDVMGISGYIKGDA